MDNIDIALKKFKEFKSKFNDYKKMDLSESDTRSKILDTIFIFILGWTEEDILREGHSDAGYYDYRFQIPNFNFICEAKKNLIDFTLPNRQNIVSLGTLYKENKGVITQIRSYLFEESIQYGIITNGNQFILSKFINVDGTPWKKNKAILFRSLDDIESRFIEFHNILSRNSIVENLNFGKIDNNIIEGKTIYQTIENSNQELIRNSLSASITPLLDLYFGEIFNSNSEEDDEELIKKCFVKNQETKKNKSEIERLFSDKPPNIDGIIPAVNTENISKQVESELVDYPAKIRQISPPKPIIIIGSKGAGKTTFINYLFKYSFSSTTLKERPVVYLDIRDYTEFDLNKNTSRIYKDITEKLYLNYSELQLHKAKVLKRIYKKDIERNNESIWIYDDIESQEYKNKISDFYRNCMLDYQNHFIKLSEYLIRERRIRVCIVFDNADQLDVGTQKNTFLLSQSINSRAKCGVILSLREGYYYKWKDKPPFDAYYSHVYHVTAAPYGEILQRRIDYALSKVRENDTIRGNSDLYGGGNIEISKQSVIDFLNSAKTTLFNKKNREMLDFLSYTTHPNIREGLKLFKRFLISGHTQVEQYVIRQHLNPTSKIPIPIHEFVKAVALDNKKMYNRNESIVYNLFAPCGDHTNHFLKLRILIYLNTLSNNLRGIEKFSKAENIINFFNDCGYRIKDIVEEINDLLLKGLLISQKYLSDTSEFDKVSLDDGIAISMKGYYYSNIMVSRFHYLELTAQDTPIYERKYFDEIRKKFSMPNSRGNNRLSNRIEFTLSFIEYLKAAELKERSNNKYEEKINIMQNIFDRGLNAEITKMKEILSK